MSIVIVAAQNKGRRRGGGKEDRKKKKKKSQVPPSPLFEYEPALTAKVKKKPAYSICTKRIMFRLTSCVCHHLWSLSEGVCLLVEVMMMNERKKKGKC